MLDYNLQSDCGKCWPHLELKFWSFRDFQNIIEAVKGFKQTLLVQMKTRKLENFKSKRGQQLPQSLYDPLVWPFSLPHINQFTLWRGWQEAAAGRMAGRLEDLEEEARAWAQQTLLHKCFCATKTLLHKCVCATNLTTQSLDYCLYGPLV